LQWGWFADRFGRKPAMVLGIAGTIFSIVLFGTAQNFAWAIAARFLWGLLNGNVGVAKTYMAEVCDETNQAKGFSVIGTTAGLGRLLGSVVGGFLAQPADKYPLLKLAFFCTFPYLLPGLVGLFVAVLALVLCIIFLKETLNKKKKEQKSTDDRTQGGRHRAGVEKDLEEVALLELEDFDSGAETDLDEYSNSVDNEWKIAETHIDSPESLPVDEDNSLSSNSSNSTDSGAVEPIKGTTLSDDVCSEGDREVGSLDEDGTDSTARTLGNPVHTNGVVKYAQLESSEGRQRTRMERVAKQLELKCKGCGGALWRKLKYMSQLLRDRRVVLSVSLYGLAGFVQVMLTELFPLLMVNNYENGGYHMDDNEIAVAITVGVVFQLLFQIFLFPYVARCLGYRNCFRFFVLMTAVLSVLLPLSNKITGPIASDVGTNSSLSLFNTSFYNATYNVSSQGNQSLPFCGKVYEDSKLHDDSVVRIPFVVWLVLCMQVGLQITARIAFFTSVMIMIGNSTVPESRGTVNGIGQSLVAVGRSVGPILASSVFAWSASNDLNWPVNYHMMFDIIAIICIGIVIVSLFLPKSIEKKREEKS
jgi:MFS family permease